LRNTRIGNQVFTRPRSICPFRRAVAEWPLFAHWGRARVVFGQSTAQSRDRVLLKHLAKALHVVFRLRRFRFALAYDAPRRDNRR
jgi:hypothetical protein